MILSREVTGYKVGRQKFATYAEAYRCSQATGKPIKSLGTKKVWSEHLHQYIPKELDE